MKSKELLVINGLGFNHIGVNAFRRMWYWLTNKYLGTVGIKVNGKIKQSFPLHYRMFSRRKSLLPFYLEGFRLRRKTMFDSTNYYFNEPIVFSDKDEVSLFFDNHIKGGLDVGISTLGAVWRKSTHLIT